MATTEPDVPAAPGGEAAAPVAPVSDAASSTAPLAPAAAPAPPREPYDPARFDGDLEALRRRLRSEAWKDVADESSRRVCEGWLEVWSKLPRDRQAEAARLASDVLTVHAAPSTKVKRTDEVILQRFRAMLREWLQKTPAAFAAEGPASPQPPPLEPAEAPQSAVAGGAGGVAPAVESIRADVGAILGIVGSLSRDAREREAAIERLFACSDRGREEGFGRLKAEIEAAGGAARSAGEAARGVREQLHGLDQRCLTLENIAAVDRVRAELAPRVETEQLARIQRAIGFHVDGLARAIERLPAGGEEVQRVKAGWAELRARLEAHGVFNPNV